MKRRIHLFTCLLAGMLLVLSGCNSSDSSDTLDAGEEVKVTLLQTSDVHHHASGTGASATYSPMDGKDSSEIDDFTKGGYGRIAAKVFQIRDDKDNQEIPTLLVDSGDFLMGTPYDLTLGSTPGAFKFMQEMQYDAITLGNHEFDYGVAALAKFLNNVKVPSDVDFTVPIVSTNMVTSDASDKDDAIEACIASGMIKNTLVKTLSNGLKVGIIGLLGNHAQDDAPMSKPLAFKNSLIPDVSLTAPDDIAADEKNVAENIAFLQGKVDDLKKNQGVHLVIALSHSGVTDTTPAAPAGDDVVLAQKVSGIDIIASGHEHKMTAAVIKVENEVDSSHNTYIICPGQYGENLSQLDITFKQGTGVTAVALVNHKIDDSIPGDFTIDSLVELLDAGINEALAKAGQPELNDIVAECDTDNLALPDLSKETGMGNLVADSLRFINYALTIKDPNSPPPLPGLTDVLIGVAPNGLIRNGFEDDQKISFADMYNVLPLGVSPITETPGYPLVKVYLTGKDIKTLCQISAYVMAKEDKSFIVELMKIKDSYPPAKLLLGVLDMLKPSLYLNLSGINFDIDLDIKPADLPGSVFYKAGAFMFYHPADFTCSAVAGIPVDDGTRYPVVLDYYTISAMLTLMGIVEGNTDINNPVALGFLGLSIVKPTDKDGIKAVTLANLTEFCVDMNADPSDKIQEVKAWQAFYTFLKIYPGFAKADGEEYRILSEALYGKTTLNRVTPPTP